jgi:3-oxoadipate enol-lactonase
VSDVTTVVAVHGLGLDGASFDPLVRQLDGWDVHAPDLRGHGSRRDVAPVTLRAMADDVLEVLERTGTQAHLLGHSIGGIVAGIAAVTRPDLVASLTIVASAPKGFAVFAARAEAAERDGLDAQVKETLVRWFGPAPSEIDPVVAAAERSVRSMTVQGWAAAWRAFADFAGFEALHAGGALGARTLCVSTVDDRSTSPAVVAQVADAFPGSRHVTLDAGGHLGLLDHPTEFATLLATHWRAWQPLTSPPTDRTDS